MTWIALRDHAKSVRWGLIAASVVVWAITAAIFFRYPLFSSFDVIFGDRGDGRMIVYLHEHLFKVLQGKAQFISPGFYYPLPDVLGMGPAFLLNLVPYAILRTIGCDPFLAFQLVIVILSLACFVASLVIATRYLHVRTSVALCVAVLMTFPNNLFVKAGVGHTNFLLLYYVPCIVAIALWGIEDFPHVKPHAILRVAIAMALLALLFSTDVYTAWMFTLTLLIAGSTVMALRGRSVTIFTRQHWRPLTIVFAAVAIAFGIAFIPFLLIYVPVRSIAPLRTYREYLAFAPFPPDIINVSSWNLLWGWLVELVHLRQGSESMLAVTPGMTALFLSFVFLLHNGPQAARPWQTVFVACSAAVWAIGWLLTLRIGTVSGFWLVRYLVPGATGIRAGMRIQLMANLWIVLGLAVSLEYWLRTTPIARLGRRNLLVGGVLLFCLIEQINLMNNSQLPRARELAFLAAVPKPPAQCRAFFVDALRRSDYLDQADAMWISLQIGLPTLNGLAGWIPPEWTFNGTTDNLDAARHWIAYTGLREQVCLYDRSARRWSLFQ